MRIDNQMPVLTGEQLSAMIKQKRPKLPIIMLTSDDFPEPLSSVDILIGKGNLKVFELLEAVERLLTAAPTPKEEVDDT